MQFYGSAAYSVAVKLSLRLAALSFCLTGVVATVFDTQQSQHTTSSVNGTMAAAAAAAGGAMASSTSSAVVEAARGARNAPVPISARMLLECMDDDDADALRSAHEGALALAYCRSMSLSFRSTCPLPAAHIGTDGHMLAAQLRPAPRPLCRHPGVGQPGDADAGDQAATRQQHAERHRRVGGADQLDVAR